MTFLTKSLFIRPFTFKSYDLPLFEFLTQLRIAKGIFEVSYIDPPDGFRTGKYRGYQFHGKRPYTPITHASAGDRSPTA